MAVLGSSFDVVEGDGRRVGGFPRVLAPFLQEVGIAVGHVDDALQRIVSDPHAFSFRWPSRWPFAPPLV